MINGAQFGYSAGHYYYCKYLRNKYNITYLCFDRGLPMMNLEGVEVIYIPFIASKFNRTLGFIKSSIYINKQIKPEVLHIVYFNFAFILAILCNSKKSILDIRTGDLSKNTFIRSAKNTFIRLQSIFFKKIIVLSESLRSRLKLSIEKTLVLPLGSECYDQSKKKYDQLNLLYVGTLDNREIEKTIEGVSIFKENNYENPTKITYDIIGFGSTNSIEKILNTIKTKNLTNVVKFHGRKNYNELPEYFHKNNIGVSFVPITDFYNVQPPTKTYEYIINGLYTIATSTNENKNIINNSNGILCFDTPIDFAKSLNTCLSKRNEINSDTVRDSLKEYQWINLINNKLIPFIT